MENINRHINEFLNYYYNIDYSPEYAVLIKGAWGTGKSWLIKESLKNLGENKEKYIYVSLYGAKNFEDIEESFFQQVYPKLSSNKVKIASKIFNGVFKAATRIDFDINALKKFENIEEYILIFDDLERCSMNISDVLGYINHFVEHKGHKVIIIANENEITKNKDGENKYLIIKEKTIGKTLEMKPDVITALNHFIEEIDNTDVKYFFKDNCKKIIEIYNSSKYKNLRHLKHFLWDFERLYLASSPTMRENEKILKVLLKLYLAYYFEIKSGNIKPNEIKEIKSSKYKSIFNNGESKTEKTLYFYFTLKYPTVNFSETILDNETWEEILDKGLINPDKISDFFEIYQAKDIPLWKKESTPIWKKLWYFMELTDDEFDNYVNELIDGLSNNLYDNENIIKHIAGILMKLSDNKLISQTKEEILNECKKNIDNLKNNKQLTIRPDNEINFIDNECWDLLGFMGNEFSEFKYFEEYLNQKLEESRIESLPTIAKDLLLTLEEDSLLFYMKLVHTNNKESVFYNIPIFKYMNSSNFLDVFLELNYDGLKYIALMLEERYKRNKFNLYLKNDMDFLIEIKRLLSEKQNKLKNRLSGYKIKTIVDYSLSTAIENLNSEHENSQDLKN